MADKKELEEIIKTHIGLPTSQLNPSKDSYSALVDCYNSAISLALNHNDKNKIKFFDNLMRVYVVGNIDGYQRMLDKF